MFNLGDEVFVKETNDIGYVISIGMNSSKIVYRVFFEKNINKNIDFGILSHNYYEDEIVFNDKTIFGKENFENFVKMVFEEGKKFGQETTKSQQKNILDAVKGDFIRNRVWFDYFDFRFKHNCLFEIIDMNCNFLTLKYVNEGDDCHFSEEKIISVPLEVIKNNFDLS